MLRDGTLAERSHNHSPSYPHSVLSNLPSLFFQSNAIIKENKVAHFINFLSLLPSVFTGPKPLPRVADTAH